MGEVTVLERAAALVPYLREQAPLAEQARRVSDETYDRLAEAGVLRMCTPKKYGGDELDFQTQCVVLAEIARGCPSTSWCATIMSALAWMASTFPDETQDEIMGDGDPRISGVLAPIGMLTPTDGGYLLTGRWPFNTAGDGSRWILLSAILDGVPHSAIVEAGQVTRLDDWHASGMAATGSSTVVADAVFVPSRRVLSLPGMINGEYAPERHNADEPYFNLPLATVLAVNAGGTPWGAALGAMDAFLERLPGRAITYTMWDDQSAAPVTHLQVGEAAMLIDSAAAHVKLATAVLDAPADGVPSMHERVKARTHITYSTGLARRAVDTLFAASGASSIQSGVPIQRFQRDIQALSNHAIMHEQTGTEMYGRFLCGHGLTTVLV
ncbi:MAG: acyl-CoA dehydrogenase family protein [Actinobacteria bacterium]|nr:acyl-CoA dehydrogenase family protein [Actinomycetota bacterium]